MKIIPTKRKVSKKIVIGVAAGLFVLIALSFLYVYGLDGNLFGWTNHRDEKATNTTIDYGKASDEQIKAGNEIKQGSSENTQSSPNTATTGGSKTNVVITITAANQTNGVLQIRSMLSSLDNTGTCTLTMTKTGATTVTKTAGAQALASSSTCEGFDIPLTELSPGSWRLSLSYESQQSLGSTSMDISIN